MTDQKLTHDELTRENLEREAERVRARLMSTLDVLDRRRHDALDVRAQVQRHVVPVAAVGAGLVLLVGGAIGLSSYRAIDRRRHKSRERVRAFWRIWKNPERTGSYEPRSVLSAALRKALVAAASMVAVELTKRAVRAMAAPADDERIRAEEASGSRPHAPVTRIDERLRIAR
jgi:hypothetical protein